jgi:hypothetical protein
MWVRKGPQRSRHKHARSPPMAILLLVVVPFLVLGKASALLCTGGIDQGTSIRLDNSRRPSVFIRTPDYGFDRQHQCSQCIATEEAICGRESKSRGGPSSSQARVPIPSSLLAGACSTTELRPESPRMLTGEPQRPSTAGCTE